MRYFVTNLAVILCMFILSGFSIADKTKEDHHLTPYTGTPEFEKMKSLVGTWKGKMKMGEEEMELIVVYSTSSAGSVIIEKAFPGTPKEMVSVYYDKDGKLTMTHFCALKNQPQMTLADSNDSRINLKFSGGSNLNPEKDMYMHSVSIDFVDDDEIIQTWTQYEGDKQKGETAFTLTRAE